MKTMRKDQIKYLDELLTNEVAEGKIPGSSVLIGDNAGIRYQNAYGAVREDSIFCLCSMTKALTASAALLLMERGIISRDEPVAKYLPSFGHHKLYRDGKLTEASQKMQIGHLLNMTSGLLYPIAQGYDEDIHPAVMEQTGEVIKKIKDCIDAGNALSCTQACDMLGEAPLAFEPGTRWAYGMSADVLAGVIEAASGKNFCDFLKTELLLPLGMEDTDFLVPEEKLDRVANILSQDEKPHRLLDGKDGFPSDGRRLSQMPYVTAGGGGWMPFFGRGLYSTADDYGKFCQMLLNGGSVEGHRILASHSIREMSENRLTRQQSISLWPEMLDGYGYGNLMRVMLRPTECTSFGNEGEFGWDGLLGTYFFVDPKAGIYFVYMQQGPVDFTVRHKMRRIVYSLFD